MPFDPKKLSTPLVTKSLVEPKEPEVVSIDTEVPESLVHIPDSNDTQLPGFNKTESVKPAETAGRDSSLTASDVSNLRTKSATDRFINKPLTNHPIPKPVNPVSESSETPHDPSGAILDSNLLINQGLDPKAAVVKHSGLDKNDSSSGTQIHSNGADSNAAKLVKLHRILQMRCSDSQNVEHAFKEIKSVFGL